MTAHGRAAVVIPTYDEVETVPGIVSSLRDFATVAEICVVDDDSPDGTAAAVRDRFGDCEDVAVIQRTNESGLSSAVIRGFDAADSDILCCMDGDGQHPPDGVATAAALVDDGADLVVGSRHAGSGRVEGEWPAHRRLISWGADRLARLAVPAARRLDDPLSGLFAIDADLYRASRHRLQPTGYKILLEVLGRCPVERVEEIGIAFRTRQAGQSNMGAREMVNYARHLGRLSIPARRGESREQEVTVDAPD